MHADAAGLDSEQDQKPYLNQAECKEGAERGLRGLGKHEESVDARRSSRGWTNRSRAPPFIDTNLFVIPIESFLRDVAVL